MSQLILSQPEIVRYGMDRVGGVPSSFMNELQYRELEGAFGGLRRGLLVDEAGSGRSRRSCPGGSGNLGFNSFNFMAFIVLVFNAV